MCDVIPCLYQPPNRGDNTVLEAQGGTATPGATKQLLQGIKRIIYINTYIYMYIYDRSIKNRDYIERSYSFLVCRL